MLWRLAIARVAHDSFDALEPELQEQVIESVMAVLEAVREPSEAMINAGNMANGELGDIFLSLSFPDMIDAAIAEG